MWKFLKAHKAFNQHRKAKRPFSTTNPSTSQIIEEIAKGDKADIDLAVEERRTSRSLKAKQGSNWREMNFPTRLALLNK